LHERGFSFLDELVVKREPGQYADYKSLDSMIREAFDEARRQIEQLGDKGLRASTVSPVGRHSHL
jgi:hypothetical protein